MKRVVHLGLQPPADSLKSSYKSLTPHRRAARAIGARYKPLDREAERTLRREGLKPASALAAHRLLAATVSEVLGHGDPAGVATRLHPSIQALFRSGSDIDELLDDENPRIRQTALVAGRFRQNLRERNLVDPAESLWAASSLARARRAVFIYGYFRPRPDELEFIDAVSGDGSCMAIPCFDHAMFKENLAAVEFLAGRGWEIIKPSDGSFSFVPSKPGLQVSAFSYADLEAEARGALAQVKRLLLNGVQEDEIVLVARDDRAYGPVLLSIGWEYGIPVRVLYDTGIEETRFGFWLQTMVESAISGLPFESTYGMLSHCLGPEAGAEVLGAARILHACGLSGWGALGIDLSHLDWPSAATRRDWTNLVCAGLERSGVAGRVDRWEREAAAHRSVIGNLDNLLSEDPDEVISADRFSIELDHLLATLRVPSQAGGGGVELHQPEVLFGSRYRHVFVLGMHEGSMPKAPVEDSLLDFHERKRLARRGIKLDSAVDLVRREELSFRLMIDIATESIAFSYPRMVGNSEAIPGAFLRRLEIDIARAGKIDPVSPEEERRAWIEDPAKLADDEVAARSRRALSAEARRESSGPFDEFDGVTGIPLQASSHQWSASQLTIIGQCPFRWFASRLLRIAEPGEMETETTASLKGSLYHKALELALAGLAEGEDPRLHALQRIEEAFIRAESIVGIPSLPAWRAQRREHIDTLRKALLSPEFITEGSSVIARELEFDTFWYGLRVRGRIDRIDRTAEGIEVVDYKIGASVPAGVKDESGEAKLDIQLPIYIAAARESRGGNGTAAGRYYSLRKGANIGQADSSQSPELEAFAERVRRHLREGSFPVDPDNNLAACGFCDLDLVCRKGDRLARKRSG